MAETGNPAPLKAELEVLIKRRKGKELFVDDSISPPTGSRTFQIRVSRKFSYITFVSMVAPSPDWFLGVTNYNLLKKNKFIKERTIKGIVYDAGTDSGITF